MKKISLKDVKNGLKRDEMRMVVGGGCGDNGCCIYYSGGRSCGYSVSQAQSYYQNGGAGYCCASC